MCNQSNGPLPVRSHNLLTLQFHGVSVSIGGLSFDSLEKLLDEAIAVSFILFSSYLLLHIFMPMLKFPCSMFPQGKLVSDGAALFCARVIKTRGWY